MSIIPPVVIASILTIVAMQMEACENFSEVGNIVASQDKTCSEGRFSTPTGHKQISGKRFFKQQSDQVVTPNSFSQDYKWIKFVFIWASTLLLQQILAITSSNSKQKTKSILHHNKPLYKKNYFMVMLMTCSLFILPSMQQSMSDYAGERVLLQSYEDTYPTGQNTTMGAALAADNQGDYQAEWIVEDNGDGTYSFKANYMAQTDGPAYISMSSSSGPIVTTRGGDSSKEWTVTFLVDGRSCIQNPGYGKYLAIDSAGTSLIPVADCKNENAKWTLIQVSNEAIFSTLGNIKVSFRASSFGNEYLSTDGAHIIRSSHQDRWANFWLIPYGDGTYFLETSDYEYLSVRGSGAFQNVTEAAKPLPYERLDFHWLGGDNYCIRSWQWHNFLRSPTPEVESNQAVRTQIFCSNNEIWTLEIVDQVSYVEINYDIDMGSQASLNPLVVATQILDNRNSTGAQTMTFSFSKSLSETNTFEHSHGFKVGVQTQIKAGVPFLAESMISVSLEQENSWTFGSENSEQVTFTSNNPLAVPPGKAFKGVATVKQTKMTIPYTGIVHFASTTVTKSITGIYHGVNFYYLTLTITDVTEPYYASFLTTGT